MYLISLIWFSHHFLFSFRSVHHIQMISIPPSVTVNWWCSHLSTLVANFLATKEILVASLLVTKETLVFSLLVTKETLVARLLVIKETLMASLLVIEETVVANLLVTKETLVASLLVTEETVVANLLVIKETLVARLLVTEETVVANLLVTKETLVARLLVTEETVVANLLVTEETIMSGLLVTEETMMTGLLVTEERMMTGLLVTRETMMTSLMVTKETLVVRNMITKLIGQETVATSGNWDRRLDRNFGPGNGITATVVHRWPPSLATLLQALNRKQGMPQGAIWTAGSLQGWARLRGRTHGDRLRGAMETCIVKSAISPSQIKGWVWNWKPGPGCSWVSLSTEQVFSKILTTDKPLD